MTDLETWSRDHLEEGEDGGAPLLFYYVYGDIDSSVPLSKLEYRCESVPEGIEVVSYGPEAHPDLLDDFREGHFWREFLEEQPGCAARVAEAKRCVLVHGTPSDSTTLNYLRDTIGLVTYLLDRGGIAVCDPQMFRWWTPAAWRQVIFESSAPVPRHHVVILVSEDEKPSRKWFHTRGMRKFGRPDISVRNVRPELESAVVDLCNRLIEHQASGLVVPDRKDIKMESLPPGSYFRHAGHLDDPDFNNVHLQVLLAGAA